MASDQDVDPVYIQKFLAKQHSLLQEYQLTYELLDHQARKGNRGAAQERLKVNQILAGINTMIEIMTALGEAQQDFLKLGGRDNKTATDAYRKKRKELIGKFPVATLRMLESTMKERQQSKGSPKTKPRKPGGHNYGQF